MWTNQKKVGVFILISDRDFWAKNITVDVRSFHNDKAVSSAKQHTKLNIYMPNNMASEDMKHMLIQQQAEAI